ncbi:DUF2237 domain-containing protein [Roseibium denhamense]|uniref:DUF2237 domain-containing protein n=1 Tax=Roseibium denhamense TaxID=76305 RepID=A0ABY1PK81_9HYPH|nr:DUF2237 domain-containing protein [Roseibium denhamense]MTI05853.1 DUF2237 domain-containing protein [Roseibium denhamense]SMP35486.1 hypothetical protein SAMN06265374_4028 [Roseibium denhamense]
MAKNILGGPLEACCTDPMTGFLRDGFCRTHDQDRGPHVICAVVTDAFLAFTRSRGNDLSTPIPAYAFPGLKDGDGWCLCALRWKEAFEAGVAPKIKARSTHERALSIVSKDDLLSYRID